MKILVLSDSHGTSSPIINTIEKTSPDAVIFLGDGVREADTISHKYDIPFYLVKGNCDFGEYEDMQLIELSGKRLFFCHGHKYCVKGGCGIITQTAQKYGADIVLFGHTHIPYEHYENGMYLLNPGSCSRPRRGKPTCGIIDIANGSVVTNILQL